ncbi:WG repeat-containing protein [Chitinophaga oryzae]|uniref:WG repeat-containing protein n=1 Tax=Chitinophaga oryzae TaxID=2725414 RepID=A0AAE7D7K2_9BACT|nr:WG repeat-containing protein [Chitinophaga oryzae]QJB32477.1 WG repeat-containing protein [Chitinophaga oryzae]QJB38950.1 WG repeat-containing protein [Chitinophaga oryzae]
MKKKIVLLVCCLFTKIVIAQQTIVAFIPDENIRAIGLFTEGLAWARVSGGNLGYMDTTGKMIIAPQFREAGTFREGLAVVGQSFDGHIRYGYVDRQGRLVIPCQYEAAHDFSCGRAAVNKKGVWSYIDRQGKTALGPAFVRIDTTIDKTYGGVYNQIKANPLSFRNGRLLVRKGQRYGFVDTAGHWVIPPTYARAGEFSDGVAVVAGKEITSDSMPGNGQLAQLYNRLPAGKPEYMTNVIDTTGNLLFTTGVKELKEFTDGVAFCYQDDQWRLIDKTGKILATPTFDDLPYAISSGVFFAQVNGKEEGNKDGYLQIYNTAGQPIGKMPLCDAAGNCMYDSHLGYFSNLLAVQMESRWGFVDTTGKLVIAPFYKEISDFAGTHAAVKTADGKLLVLRNPTL